MKKNKTEEIEFIIDENNRVDFRQVLQMMKMTSHDLHEYGIVDEIIKEPAGGIRFISDEFIKELKSKLIAKINELQKMKKEELLENRYQKYRKIS